MEAGNDIDWATGEALAMGSLMYQGKSIFYVSVTVSTCTVSTIILAMNLTYLQK